ncbi:MAG: hypothetical protein QXS69_02410 [Candidatus Aenigmatarchaeota archaeon]
MNLAKELINEGHNKVNLVVAVREPMQGLAKILAIGAGYNKVPEYEALPKEVKKLYPGDKKLRNVNLFFNEYLGELSYECLHEKVTQEGYLDWNETLKVISETPQKLEKARRYWEERVNKGMLVVKDVYNKKREINLPRIVISAGHPIATAGYLPLRNDFFTIFIYATNFLWSETVKTTSHMYDSYRNISPDIMKKVEKSIRIMESSIALYDLHIMPALSVRDHVEKIQTLSRKEVYIVGYFANPPKKLDNKTKKSFGIDPEKPTITISVGRTGVGVEVIKFLAPYLSERYNVVLPSGMKIDGCVTMPSYYPNMGDFLLFSMLGVIRGGMGTVYESLRAETPPYFLRIVGDHSEIRRNEEELFFRGVAWIGDLTRHTPKEISEDIVKTIEENRVEYMKKEVRKLNEMVKQLYGLNGFEQAAKIIVEKFNF